MKKKLCALLAAVMLLSLALTGCGGNNLCAQMACGYAVCMGASTCGMRFLCC